MVIRGSKTAPDDSLAGALNELHQAQARAVEANVRLDRYASLTIQIIHSSMLTHTLRMLC
jgi:hypothetical protein